MLYLSEAFYSTTEARSMVEGKETMDGKYNCMTHCIRPLRHATPKTYFRLFPLWETPFSSILPSHAFLSAI